MRIQRLVPFTCIPVRTVYLGPEPNQHKNCINPKLGEIEREGIRKEIGKIEEMGVVNG